MMTDTRKVIVNGEEFEVELTNDGDTWTATVGGETFEIQVPDSAPPPKSELLPAENRKNQERYLQIFRAKLYL